MSENVTAWLETGFNIAYLAIIWGLVIKMTREMPQVEPENRRVAGLLRLAFILLAAGDSGHVGFRVLAHLTGGVDSQAMILGTSMSLVGLGMMITSFTITLFYMLLVYVWRMRDNQPAGWFANLLLAAGVVRLMLMALPGNDWGSAVPPQPMSLYRNLPLLLQGIGVVGLILFSAYQKHDPTFQWIGWMIVLSYAFYIPVILFAQQVPLLGMLMIPKTCAYLAVAFIAYRGLWQQPVRKAAASASLLPGG